MGKEMRHDAVRLVLGVIVAFAVGVSAYAADPQLDRGKYLVAISGCNDCHTPGYFVGQPDAARYLGGSDVGFGIPGHGVFVGPNLTPDMKTGLGGWTVQQIVTAITTGVRPDGRILAPIMPWQGFSHLTKADAVAIAMFLKSLPPVENKVAGPFGREEVPTVPVMSISPGKDYANRPKQHAQ